MSASHELRKSLRASLCPAKKAPLKVEIHNTFRGDAKHHSLRTAPAAHQSYTNHINLYNVNFS